jgi:hypothetical protein
MEIDQNKFISLVLEKTNQKLNLLQAQVIVLESQLQLAGDINKQLQDQIEKLKNKTVKDKSEFNTP